MHDHWPKDLYNTSGLTTGSSATTGKGSPRPAVEKPRTTMELPDFKQRPGQDYRQLRVITVLASLLGIALLLPHGVVAERALPAIGVAPMFISAMSGILILTGLLKSPGTKASMDLSLAAFLFSIMVPSFVSLQSNGFYQGAGLTMLGTYGTSAMIVNFTIHAYLAAISMDQIEFPRLVIAWRSSPCSHCNHDHHHLSLPGGPLGLGGAGAGLPHEHSVHGVHQPFIDSSDDAARDSSDYQTSGFGSPRRSAETLATDANDLEQRAGSFES